MSGNVLEVATLCAVNFPRHVRVFGIRKRIEIACCCVASFLRITYVRGMLVRLPDESSITIHPFLSMTIIKLLNTSFGRIII